MFALLAAPHVHGAGCVCVRQTTCVLTMLLTYMLYVYTGFDDMYPNMQLHEYEQICVLFAGEQICLLVVLCPQTHSDVHSSYNIFSTLTSVADEDSKRRDNIRLHYKCQLQTLFPT